RLCLVDELDAGVWRVQVALEGCAEKGARPHRKLDRVEVDRQRAGGGQVGGLAIVFGDARRDTTRRESLVVGDESYGPTGDELTRGLGGQRVQVGDLQARIAAADEIEGVAVVAQLGFEAIVGAEELDGGVGRQDLLVARWIELLVAMLVEEYRARLEIADVKGQ